jgi:hypothetical protein
MSISPLNKNNAMKVSRRLTGDFTNIALPLKQLVAESAPAQAGECLLIGISKEWEAKVHCFR